MNEEIKVPLKRLQETYYALIFVGLFTILMLTLFNDTKIKIIMLVVWVSHYLIGKWIFRYALKVNGRTY